ncbi:hypothetical protein E2C01_018313 [Portunus trituberculatus]|uniref:Uncharacterized protein n=1 Tax=Portunus trituberculatus TaxID=210409 RepID=A0A5B7DVS9_PORTR|nr:hypothetical protein [Portunus trituberculatus]
MTAFLAYILTKTPEDKWHSPLPWLQAVSWECLWEFLSEGLWSALARLPVLVPPSLCPPSSMCPPLLHSSCLLYYPMTTLPLYSPSPASVGSPSPWQTPGRRA